MIRLLFFFAVHWLYGGSTSDEPTGDHGGDAENSRKYPPNPNAGCAQCVQMHILVYKYLSATRNLQLPVCNHVCLCKLRTCELTAPAIIWQDTDNDSLSLLVRVQGQGDQEEESDAGGLGGRGESHVT